MLVEFKEKSVVIVIILITACLKLWIVFHMDGPTVFGDEYLYKEIANDYANFIIQTTNQYPYVYPLILGISFLFNDFYLVMKIINIILSSIMLIIVWKLLGLFFAGKKRLLGFLLISLLPSAYIFPKYIMSENLYFLLLLISVYIMLNLENDQRIRLYFLFGLILGLMQWTRYATLVLLPFYLLLVFINFEIKNNFYRLQFKNFKFTKLIIIISGYLISSIPWLIVSVYNDFDLRDFLGYPYSGLTKLTPLNPFLEWVLLYSFYIILLISFLLPMILIYIKFIKEKNLTSIELKLLVFSVITTLCLTYVSVRHSWLGSAIDPIPSYILGRYIIYIAYIWAILFLIAFWKTNFTINKNLLIITTMVTIILTLIGYSMIVDKEFFELSNYFLIEVNSDDVYYFAKDHIRAVIIIGLVILLGLFMSKINDKIKQGCYFAYIFIIYLITIATMIISISTPNQYDSGIHGINLYKAYNKFSSRNEMIDITISDTVMFNKSTASDLLRFWSGESEGYNVLNLNEINPHAGLFLTRNRYGETPVQTYSIDNTNYYIYELPINHSMQILKTYPSEIIADQDFNIQPDGNGAIAIEGEGFADTCIIYFNDMPFGKVAFGGDTSVSSLVPKEYIQNSGILKIQLKFETEYGIQIESNIVELPIKES
ncbi:MAG: glycosyltransferase family 39 protein [Eubacteriales bacterium]|nr:glycosyltransferase family 39 protein [Eubacteriales bacterium]